MQANGAGMGFWLALACRDGLVRHACGSLKLAVIPYPLIYARRTDTKPDSWRIP